MYRYNTISNINKKLVLKSIENIENKYNNLYVYINTYNLLKDDYILQKDLNYLKDKINQVKFDYNLQNRNNCLLFIKIDQFNEKYNHIKNNILYF